MSDRRPLILSVDDEPDICAMIKDFLEDSEEYEVITTVDSTQALDLVVERSPDLLLMDVRMPGKTGLEVLQEVRQHDEDIAVIMVTAVRDVDTALNAVRLGADDYIVKPLSVGELLVAVDRALDRRRLVLENRDYRRNLEAEVAEQTEHLEQKVRELTALNSLFQSHLNQRYQVEVEYGHLASRIAAMADELRNLADASAARREQMGEVGLAVQRDGAG